MAHIESFNVYRGEDGVVRVWEILAPFGSPKRASGTALETWMRQSTKAEALVDAFCVQYRHLGSIWSDHEFDPSLEVSHSTARGIAQAIKNAFLGKNLVEVRDGFLAVEGALETLSGQKVEDCRHAALTVAAKLESHQLDRDPGEKSGDLISDRSGPNAARSVEEDQIIKFRAVVAEDPDRAVLLSADVAHKDREHYGFPEHTEFSAGVTAMHLLESQSKYFPLHDALECVNGYHWEDPPIVVEALRADGSVHSRWEFTTFEFDRGVLEDGESYPTYYLGEKSPVEIEHNPGQSQDADVALDNGTTDMARSGWER